MIPATRNISECPRVTALMPGQSQQTDGQGCLWRRGLAGCWPPDRGLSIRRGPASQTRRACGRRGGSDSAGPTHSGDHFPRSAPVLWQSALALELDPGSQPSPASQMTEWPGAGDLGPLQASVSFTFTRRCWTTWDSPCASGLQGEPGFLWRLKLIQFWERILKYTQKWLPTS